MVIGRKGWRGNVCGVFECSVSVRLRDGMIGMIIDVLVTWTMFSIDKESEDKD